MKKRDTDGDGTPDEYVFRTAYGKTPGHKGQIMTDAGVEFDYNGGGMYGGLFSEGTIHASTNDHEFIGDPDTLRGLALGAMGGLDIDRSSVRLQGIVGSDGNMFLGRMGEGTGPDIDGVLIPTRRSIVQTTSVRSRSLTTPRPSGATP